MKNLKIILGTLGLLVGITGCTSAYYQSSSNSFDDLYSVHDKTAIARKQKAAAEVRKAEAEARQAEWEARLAEAQAQATEDAYNSGNLAMNIEADSYESAYARRLQGFQSSSYRMPSSYFELRYNNTAAVNMAMSYNPEFYNVMVSGDQVWVEPRYITSMFGSWGASPVRSSWYVGWGYSPYSYNSWWGYPRYSWWDWNWSVCYNPWGNPWHNHFHDSYYPGWGHGPSYRPYNSNIVHRPRPYTSPSSGTSYGRTPTYDRGNAGSGSYNSGVYQGNRNQSGNRGSGTYQGGNRFQNGSSGSSTVTRPSNGGNSYNSGTSSSSSDRTNGRRGASTGSSSNSSYTRPSYSGNNNSSSFSGSSSSSSSGSSSSFSGSRGSSSTGSSSRGR